MAKRITIREACKKAKEVGDQAEQRRLADRQREAAEGLSFADASYARHCKDPIAAAESDVLGEAIRLLAELREDYRVWHGDSMDRADRFEEEIDALLARVRGEE